MDVVVGLGSIYFFGCWKVLLLVIILEGGVEYIVYYLVSITFDIIMYDGSIVWLVRFRPSASTVGLTEWKGSGLEKK